MYSDKEIILIGYSGHAFVVCDILQSQNLIIGGYCDQEVKQINPYNLEYIGSERTKEAQDRIKNGKYFTAIGDNSIRSKVNQQLYKLLNIKATQAIHRQSIISPTAILSAGVMVSSGCIINACSVIGEGVICNTQSVIEHECHIGEYSHIAPGTILCGGVSVGSHTFIGARSVVKQGVKIGDNVTIGAGTVVICDIPDNSVVVGNPQRYL